jgi:hypothetical protein
MAVHPTLSTVTTGYFRLKSNIHTMNANADKIIQPFFLKYIQWNVTTAYTSTWALHVEQTTDSSGTTYQFPLIGTSAVGYFPGCAQTTLGYVPPIMFKFECPVYGLVLSTISGGSITIVKGYLTGQNVAW